MTTDTDIKTVTTTKIATPKLYQVIIHNDDYTPMEFVVSILINIFHKNIDEATDLMMKVHMEGQGCAGVYPHEIAIQKSGESNQLSKAHGHPLVTTVEVN